MFKFLCFVEIIVEFVQIFIGIYTKIYKLKALNPLEKIQTHRTKDTTITQGLLNQAHSQGCDFL